MSVESVIKLGVGKVALSPSPIYPNWILEGNPVCRNQKISSSQDGTATTFIWECTAGRFNWFYDDDETIYVIEGGVVVKDGSGAVHRLNAGDTIFFPAGSRAEWLVEKYIRKIAFVRTPLPPPVLFVKRGMRFLRRLIRGGNSPAVSSAMLQNN
jgi:hypothetical protein